MNGCWSKLLSGGELKYLEYRQYFESICCEHSKYLRVHQSWYSEYSNHSGFCTAGTACYTRGSVLLIIFPVLAVFKPSVLVVVILTVRAVFRTPHTRVLQYIQHQQYPEYLTPQYCQHRQHQKRNVSNIIRTNIMYHAALSYTDIPTYSSINSSVWSIAEVLLLCIT